MKYAYIRVSSAMQNEERQLEAMKRYDIPAENYFIEKISGKNMERPELQRLLETIQEGDVIHIHDFSRLSRSTADLLKMVEKFNEMGVTLISNKENLDTSTPTGKLMLTMIGAIYEFELANLHDRQSEGVACAKAKGVYIRKHFNDGELENLKRLVDEKRITVTRAAEILGITRKTWYLRTKHLGNNSDTLDA